MPGTVDEAVGLGILGLGAAGVRMLEAARRHPDVRLVALAEADPALRDRVPRGYTVLHEDVGSLSADASVDAVYVATPTDLHVAHAVTALEAGKDVLIEKPVSPDLARAEELCAAAAAAGRVLVVGHSQSFEPFVRGARLAAEEHDLGEPVSLVVSEETDWMLRPRLPAELDEQAGGGPILRQGAHLVDTVRYLTYGQRVVDVNARGSVAGDQPCRGAFVATLTLEGGTQATLSYNGFGGAGQAVTSAGADGTTEPSDVLKTRRNITALERVLAADGGMPPPAGDGRSMLVLYRHGVVSVHGDHVEVFASTHRGSYDVSGLTDGRTAVLDELVGACRGRPPLHDGRWGAENLRICLEIAASSASSDHAYHLTSGAT